jgi:hypothetical protein
VPGLITTKGESTLQLVLMAILHGVMAALLYLSDHPSQVAVVASIVAAGLEAMRGTGNLKAGILAIMLRAEKAATAGEFGTITGSQLMDKVVQLTMEKIVPRLPAYWRPYCTAERVRKLAYYVYADSQLLLTGGRLIPLPGDDSAAAIFQKAIDQVAADRQAAVDQVAADRQEALTPATPSATGTAGEASPVELPPPVAQLDATQPTIQPTVDLAAAGQQATPPGA